MWDSKLNSWKSITHNSAPNFGLLCITMRKWNGEGSFACIYYGFYLWKDRDKRNFKNINRALEIQNYKCCLGNVESLPDNSRAVKDLSPLFITSLPWRFFLHLSRPFSYSCWVILIHRSSALMAGIGSWLILTSQASFNTWAKEQLDADREGFAGEAIIGCSSRWKQTVTFSDCVKLNYCRLMNGTVMMQYLEVVQNNIKRIYLSIKSVDFTPDGMCMVC